MKKLTRAFAVIAALMIVLTSLSAVTFAEDANPTESAEVTETAADNSVSAKAIAAAIAVGIAAFSGAIGMAMAIGKAAESIARQPEASGSIRTTLMLGLVFIETAIIYALIVAILIVFVL